MTKWTSKVRYLLFDLSSVATEVVDLVQVVLGEGLDEEEEERHSVEPHSSSSATEAADQTWRQGWLKEKDEGVDEALYVLVKSVVERCR